MSLIGKHLLSVEALSRQDLDHLCSVATRLEPIAKGEYRCDVLQGALLANLFYEPSTRTRMSFHTAFTRLGGSVVSSIGMDSSSISKGESLEDTARVIAGYADVIAMRHPQEGAVAQFAEPIFIPVVNAGDGTGEHPSQALLDFYTIQKEFKHLGKSIEGLRIALVGDLKHGRTIHSLCKLLALLDKVEFNFIAPSNLAAPESLLQYLKERGHTVNILDSLQQRLDVDVLYATRIQRERIENGENLPGYGEQFRVNAAMIRNYANPDTIILHPLPRDSRPEAFDLDCDLDSFKQLAIFRQTDNGVMMRMAIFACLLGVDDVLETHFHKRLGFRPQYYRKMDSMH